jgi:phospho-N-acetylmuramoyl-pentapeptide-transferase
MRLILISGSIALFLSLFGTPVLIRFLARRGYGQIIRDDGPSSHHTKRGTPTMGGIVFITGSLLGYFVAKAVNFEVPSISALLALFMMVGLGLVGFLDDYIKTHKQRSLGLTGWAKIQDRNQLGTDHSLLDLWVELRLAAMAPAEKALRRGAFELWALASTLNSKNYPAIY